MKFGIKFVLVILLVLMVMQLVACGKGGEVGDTTSGIADTTTAVPGDSTSHKDTEESTTEAQTTTAAPVIAEKYKVLNYSDFKAMWLSQYDLSSIYCSGSSQRSEQSFTSYMKTILSNVKGLGINTVIVQVRPFADSMYPSEYYPMSSMVVGSYGKEATYDPFAIIVEEAHAQGLSVQAWINPMRAMLDTEISRVDDKYPIKQWYNDPATKGKYVVKSSTRWYLNVAYDEVRQLIIDGAREIIENYDVDGLHMDDYFYPTTDASFDSAAYAEYVRGGGKLSLADWRREQLNKLVSGLWSMVKEHDSDILFGISPAGNFNTVYNSQYADIYTWCAKEGYIDYICPQVYFGFEHGSCDFVKVSTTYQNMIKTDKVKLIIGMTLGKALSGSQGTEDKYAGTGKREWIENQDILLRGLEYTKQLPKCAGVAYFCYQYFYNPTSGAAIPGTKAERDNFLPLLQTISWQ
ncbi:MAG: family 10 glycosylhydrolase [Clostridia bacterium]|nr:family 10 glycosylhydrolase [Clostridia bacterium]